MGFIRKQEEKFAFKLLEWRYQRDQRPIPEKQALREHAARIVSEAHAVARERGGNVVSILKDMISSRR